MRRIAAVTAATLVALSLVAQAAPKPSFTTDRARYARGGYVTIELHNPGPGTLEITGDWTIRTRDGRDVSLYVWPEDVRAVAPGGSRIWRWEQNDGGCYGICQNVHWGTQAAPDRYVVTAPTSAGELEAAFDIGEYFTLGFRHAPELSFTTFVRTADEVAAMETEAAKPRDERTLIVSGIVRKQRRYNRDWSYTMGPGSIVLGEVFVEVCDADPNRVENHRRRWMGERWCPWSSYVERVGR